MGLQRRLILLTLVAAFGCLDGCSGATSSTTTATMPSSAPSASAYVGLWQNVDASTSDNPQLQIRVDGSTIYVHGYGACSPTFCDWGEASAPISNAASGSFTVNWLTAGVISDQMTLTLSTGDGLLRGTLMVHFTNGQQPDRSDLQIFKKAS